VGVGLSGADGVNLASSSAYFAGSAGGASCGNITIFFVSYNGVTFDFAAEILGSAYIF